MTMENIRDIAFSTLLMGMILWMIFSQLGNMYVKKHRKELCLMIYGSENYRGGKFDIYDYFLINIVPLLIHTNYYLHYKRIGFFRMEMQKGKYNQYPGLTTENALIIFNNHKKWFYYNAIAMVFGFVFVIVGIYIGIAEL